MDSATARVAYAVYRWDINISSHHHNFDDKIMSDIQSCIIIRTIKTQKKYNYTDTIYSC